MRTVSSHTSWFVVVGALLLCAAVSADVSGSIVKARQWNNYGYSVSLYQNTVKIAQALTSVNGFFQIAVPAGRYEMLVNDGSLALASRVIESPGKITIKIPESRAPFYPVELLGFFSAVLILILGLIAFLMQRSVSGLLFLGMASGFALVNGTEGVQSAIALSHESLAGTIFVLKHMGLVCFGVFLVLFVQAYNQHKTSSWLLVLGFFESLLLASWMYFSSDQAFTQFWHVSYGSWRDIFVIQTLVLIVWAYIVTVIKSDKVLLKAGLLWFLIIFVTLVFLPVVLQHGTEFFALQYNIAASLSGLILFLSFFSVLMTIRIMGVEQFVAGAAMYSVMSLLLIGVYAVVIVSFGRFVQYAHNELLSVYALLMVVMVILPFKDRVQSYLEQRLLGDTARYREALTILTDKLNRAVTLAEVQRIVKIVFKKYFGTIATVQCAHVDSGISYFLKTDHPATLIIASKDKVFSQGELQSYDKACAPISLALNRVFAYERQIKALQEIELHARLASLGTLSAGLAHEIKNPLAVLHNIISVLPKSSIGKIKAEYIPILQRQVERMQDLVHNMLQFARPESLEFNRCNVKEIVEKTVALIKSTAKKHGVDFKIKLTNMLIVGDERALEQVFLNIFMNAIESMPQGGILKISLCQGVLEITDTGIGMDMQTVARIFDPFFTTKVKGTGLGLAISRRILEKHHAVITVESQVAQGTTFKITFKR